MQTHPVQQAHRAEAKARGSRLRRTVSTVMLALVVTSSLGTSPAAAINPPQTTVVGTVNTLYADVNYWSYRVVASTGRTYRSPLVGYAYTTSPTNFGGACNLEAAHMAIYCGGNVYINVPVNQSKLNRIGDYAAGYWLAHEFGHHIANSIGYRFRSTAGRELYADCMAGVFTRWGYARGRLTGTDYSEALRTLGDNPYPYEGSAGGYPLKSYRQAWFTWGYTNNNVALCAAHTVNLVA